MNARYYKNTLTNKVYRVRQNPMNENYSIISNNLIDGFIHGECTIEKFIGHRNSFKTFDQAQIFLNEYVSNKHSFKEIETLPII